MAFSAKFKSVHKTATTGSFDGAKFSSKRAVLNSKYQGSVHKPVDKYWIVGQTCVARWDLDGKWYRAQVLVVGYQEFTVQFVDYGTVEIVTVEDTRKDLFTTEMPIQCFPVQLENIQPITDKWERPVLDFLHSNVVDQSLSVIIPGL